MNNNGKIKFMKLACTQNHISAFQKSHCPRPVALHLVVRLRHLSPERRITLQHEQRIATSVPSIIHPTQPRSRNPHPQVLPNLIRSPFHRDERHHPARVVDGSAVYTRGHAIHVRESDHSRWSNSTTPRFRKLHSVQNGTSAGPDSASLSAPPSAETLLPNHNSPTSTAATCHKRVLQHVRSRIYYQ